MKLSQAKAALRQRTFLRMCRQAGLPDPWLEYRFAPPRRWRFDYSWPDPVMLNGVKIGDSVGSVALEVEGGAYVQGRHTRGAGFVKDLEKYNRATVLGWRILRVTPQQLCTQETIGMLKALLT